uniref:Nucleotide-diphospho-sugar transferase domain-containing protein n=1 Tax=Aegilops tauschii TaxID=37682 RepID=M8BPW0_AEGTA
MADIERLLAISKVRGWPSLLGNRKIAQNFYKGNIRVILRSPPSFSKQLHHKIFGFSMFFSARLRLTEEKVLSYHYTVNGHEYNIGYYLTNSIYPLWATRGHENVLDKYRFLHYKISHGQMPSNRNCTVRAYGGDDLEAALRGAADANRTLILSVLNKAYAEEDGLLDLFVRSLREGEGTAQLVSHVLLVAMDRPAYRRCVSLGGVRCYRLPAASRNGTQDLSSEQLYMSDGFIRMMWRRIRLLGDVLKHGYSFIFTDLDVMWLRNPFPSLKYRTGEEDLLISCDKFNGRPQDYLSNELNTGFFFVAAYNRTAALFDEWHAARGESAGMKEQDVLKRMKRRHTFRRLGVTVRVLDTARFSGFCQDSRDARQVATVHANCCRTMRAKIADLRAVLRAARRLNGTARLRWPPHSECAKSWR